ncbi:DNA polymerase III subunit chi [Aestuariivirga litoralis]|uniref:DNA polymerase III subunit chi n=1 Tax=Aestuariivirga litoralis TaxID=2650924 RepID=UPI0018C78B96|nr:DNA polymerase III subunit chi [Aestuariivirga litoralis]MBG1232023.1 DNA polymerase III subunit chi [Aestuariivirga litoralis]
MAEIYFYHLEGTPMEPLLLRMLRMGFERGIRMAIESATPDNLPKLSELLWSAEDVAFLPHGMGEDASPHHPLWLCADRQDPNNAAYRFYVEGAMPDEIGNLERALILFDSNSEDALASARNEWKKRKAEGHAISYWKMDENGKWQNLA